jgi:hypothetical protein
MPGSGYSSRLRSLIVALQSRRRSPMRRERGIALNNGSSPQAGPLTRRTKNQEVRFCRQMHESLVNYAALASTSNRCAIKIVNKQTVQAERGPIYTIYTIFERRDRRNRIREPTRPLQQSGYFEESTCLDAREANTAARCAEKGDLYDPINKTMIDKQYCEP